MGGSTWGWAQRWHSHCTALGRGQDVHGRGVEIYTDCVFAKSPGVFGAAEHMGCVPPPDWGVGKVFEDETHSPAPRLQQLALNANTASGDPPRSPTQFKMVFQEETAQKCSSAVS